MAYTILNNDCTVELERLEREIHLTFLDPPFNQGKDYNGHNDNLPDDIYKIVYKNKYYINVKDRKH